MAAALEAVKGGETILRAAQTYGVPRSTLQVGVHGKVTHGVKPGPRPYLAPCLGARVSTSSECVSILKEREEKKRIEAEVKEKRKIERERKKKEREEMAKCKAEEIARKAAERSARLGKRPALKVRTPVSKKQKVDKAPASSLEPTFENTASKEHNINENHQFHFHK